MKKKEIWFPATKYGIGWGLPSTWQGWMVLIIYTLLIFIGCMALNKSIFNLAWFYIYDLIWTALLVFICIKKGEKFEWQWGRQKRRDS